MTKLFDPTKPVQTRNGRKARIICTDLTSDDGSIAAAITTLSGERVTQFHADGRYYVSEGMETDEDLVNIPERTEQWLTCAGAVPFDSKAKLLDFYPDAKQAIVVIDEDGRPVDARIERFTAGGA